MFVVRRLYLKRRPIYLSAGYYLVFVNADSPIRIHRGLPFVDARDSGVSMFDNGKCPVLLQQDYGWSGLAIFEEDANNLGA